jgi:hypothetical protein
MKLHGRKSMAATGLIAAGLILGLAVPAAAGEAKHLINGSSIKAHTITGKQIKNNAITGTQVKESTLGTVPNAAKLGGKAASSYQGALKSDCTGDTAVASIAADGTVACTSSTIMPFYYVISASAAQPYKAGIAMGDSGIDLGLACHDPGSQIDFEDETADNATVNWSYSNGGASSTVNASGAVIDANATNAAIFHFESARLEGQFIFAVPSSTPGLESIMTVNMHGYDGGSYCEYSGTAEIGTAATS